jgi:hypothetical protein
MKIKRHSSETRRRMLRSRGSALLVSLMVLAGLSLLALAFVGVSETEGKISASQRNALQTQAIAEAGARAVVEWFQAPVWAQSIGIMPANANNNEYPAGLKRRRDGTTGYYKPNVGTERLFDLPFRPQEGNRFFGDDATADVQIDYTNSAATMTALNTYLFGADSRTAGRIEEIKVYAPPIVGGTLSPTGFWGGGQRFGTATIKVTARMWDRAVGGKQLSSQVVRIVVGEFPLPIPAGPIQTASNAAFGGSFNVYWGDEVALGNLNPAVASTRIPWQNAFERPSFEFGYANEVWPMNDPPDADPTNDLPNYLAELVGKPFVDPWVGSRARGTVSICGACATYNATSTEGDRIHAAFQNQTVTNYPVSRAVTFPTIDYNIWKRIAIQSRGTKGVFYFSYDEDTNLYKRNGQGTPRAISYWVNTRAGANLGAGFYFFDTRTGANPQLVGGATNNAILGDPIDWSGNADFSSEFLMAGFIYMNVRQYSSQGAGSTAPSLPYNMPGEIYRDIGYPSWNAGTGTWNLDAAGDVIRIGAGNGQWDCDHHGDGCDIVVSAPQTVESNEGGIMTTRTVRLPVPWSVAGACTAATCSEPHEPYLNFIYPTTRTGGITVGWEAPGAQTRRPRDLLADNTLPNCGTTPSACTSNGYDRDGALVNIPATLAGVLYNEGTYNSTGNVDYFGSVLVRGSATATGTPNVWFDEKLIKGNWAPPGMPRVIVYSSQTDELEEQ